MLFFAGESKDIRLYCDCQQADSDFFVNCLPLDEWRNNFYDPKLILKHIIWIHFTMHSFIPPDTCVEREREHALARRFVLLFFMFVLCCECVWHLIKLHIWVNDGASMMFGSSFSFYRLSLRRFYDVMVKLKGRPGRF